MLSLKNGATVMNKHISVLNKWRCEKNKSLSTLHCFIDYALPPEYYLFGTTQNLISIDLDCINGGLYLYY